MISLWPAAPTGKFNSVQLLSCVHLSATPWIAARQASLSITSSWSLPKLMSVESVMPSNHLILIIPFSSCPQSFPASGSFPRNQLFSSGGQSIGVSASTSVLLVNTQDWSHLLVLYIYIVLLQDSFSIGFCFGLCYFLKCPLARHLHRTLFPHPQTYGQ